jgi:hypothetical protein
MTGNLDKFPDLGFDPNEKIAKPSGELKLPQGLRVPECTFCDQQALYSLEEIHLVVRTNDGAEHTIVTKLNPTKVILACMNHKDGEKDEEIAEGAHLSVIQDTSVHSTLVHYEVYWRMIV